MNPPKNWMTVAQCATFLSLSSHSIRRKISNGEIKSARVGRTIRISRERLEKQMEEDILNE